MATHLRFLACLENPTDGGAWRATRNNITESLTGLSNFTFTFQLARADTVFCSISSSCNSGQPGRARRAPWMWTVGTSGGAGRGPLPCVRGPLRRLLSGSLSA